jgi:hypothetical protein
MLYPIFGEGIVGTDAERRYLPQTTELSQSFDNFFFQIGPAYSLFLLFFKKIGIDIVSGAVLIQHIIGIITAFLIFHYFKKVNIFLAAFVTVFVYSGWLALWVEHTILRESLSAFFFVLLVLLLTLTVKKEEYFKPGYAFLAGLIGLILVLFRLEFILVIALFPLILLFTKKEKSFSGKKFLQWNLVYFLPIFIIFLVYGAIILGESRKDEFQYGSFFGISYYSLAYHDFLPKIFYYQNSRYPELLQRYQSALKIHQEELDDLSSLKDKRERVSRTLDILTESTEGYLAERPEVKLSANQLMDRLYLDVIQKNTLVYLQAMIINFKSHLIGVAELQSVSAKSSQVGLLKIHLSGQEPPEIEDSKPASLLDKILQFYLASMLVFSKVLFWLFLISLPILLFKWRVMPPEIIVSLFAVFLHLCFLAILADPAHRFRYAIDPFLYFSQLYIIFYLFKTILPRAIRLFSRSIG